MLNLVFFVLWLLFTYYLIKRSQKKAIYDPFNKFQLITLIQRKDNSTFERLHKRFEYIGQKTNDGRIIGIYCYYHETKKELKYRKLIEKWK